VNIDFPYAVDGRNRTQRSDRADHVRNLIEQVLLTAPGERVMRPDFGSGVLGLVFEPGGPELEATTQYLVQGALEMWLSDVVRVDALDLTATEETLTITVSYTDLLTSEHRVAAFDGTTGGAE